MNCRVIVVIITYLLTYFLQEEQNRGKPNWEHLNEELHVLISVDDTENRAKLKLARAVQEVQKLLVPTVSVLRVTDSGTVSFYRFCMRAILSSCV